MSARPRACHFLWAAGVLGLMGSHVALIARIEPFYSFIYPCLWWSFIFTLDGVVWRIHGTSLLHDRPREFWLLALWSAPLWFFFELLNFRLQNWHYVMATLNVPLGVAIMCLSFATVLPAIFEVTEFVSGSIEVEAYEGRLSGPRLRMTRARAFGLMAAGVVMLILTLALPRYCFPLAWGFAILLFGPAAWLDGERSLLGQLERGDYTRLVGVLAAGFVCGGLWESWNILAHNKWIYTVPFFDELKLGEMPVLGFLGFPPFALECYAVVNALGVLRDGRHWERSSEDNASRRGMRPAVAAILGLAALLVVAPTIYGVYRHTISSFDARIDVVLADELTADQIAALRRLDLRRTRLLAAHPERPSAFGEARWQRLKRLANLAELKGMGLRHALRLEGLGIDDAADLAGHDPEQLAGRLRAQVGPDARYPTAARVKVWVLAAREIQRRHL